MNLTLVTIMEFACVRVAGKSSAIVHLAFMEATVISEVLLEYNLKKDIKNFISKILNAFKLFKNDKTSFC